MTKNKASKMPANIVLGSPPVEPPEKKSVGRKKPRSEIDEIFSSRKKKTEQENAQDPAADVPLRPKKMKKKSKSKEGGLAEPPSRPRKRTADGLSIYTEEELGIRKADAGGTTLCPFDCDCCF